MSNLPHIADAETKFKVINVTPDFCKVRGKVVPFEIARTLPNELAEYCHSVHARGVATLKVGSIIQGVVGNAGSGVVSGVSLASGNVLTATGSGTFHVEGKRVVRHLDIVYMNVK